MRRLLGRKPSYQGIPAERWVGANLYVFVRNHPIGRRDPFGLFEGENPDKPINCEQLESEIADVEKMLGHELYHDLAATLLQTLQDLWDDNCDDDDRPPRDPVGVPVPYCPQIAPRPVLTPQKVAMGAIGGYLVYRGIRMIPSLFPPLWPTIPFNAATP